MNTPLADDLQLATKGVRVRCLRHDIKDQLGTVVAGPSMSGDNSYWYVVIRLDGSNRWQSLDIDYMELV